MCRTVNVGLETAFANLVTLVQQSDPVYYDAAYLLAPDGGAGRDVHAVLREASP